MARNAAHPPAGSGGFFVSKLPPPVRRELNALTRLAVPVVAQRLGVMAMGLADVIVVGRYSAQELGYQALGWAPTAIALTTGLGLLTGVQVMSARFLGEGRPEATGAVLRRGLVYAAQVGLACLLVMALLGPLVLGNIGLDPVLSAGAVPVMLVLSLSLPFYLIGSATTLYLEALSRPAAGMIAIWLANGLNLGLNLLLVPGVFDLPALGAVGSAWATAGSRAVLALGLLAYVFTLPQARSLGLYDKPARNKADEAEQRRIGYGGGASQFVEAGAFSVMSVYAGWLGALPVAAWAVVLNVVSVAFMVPLGLSSATAVRVGRGYGARDLKGLVRAGGVAFSLTAAVTFLVSLVLWFAPEAVAGVYTKDPALKALTAGALVLSSLFLMADGLQVVAAQALRARGEVWTPTATHVFSYAVVMLPLGYVLAHPMGMGLTGIVWAVILASLVSAGLLLGRFWMLSGRL